MAFGVTSTGFVKKTLQDIIDEKQAKAQQVFGSDVDLTETSPLQQFIEVIAVEEALLWDQAEAIYYSGFLQFATGASLDELVLLIGVTRKAATKATGSVAFTGTPATLISAGTVVMTATGIEFETDADTTIDGGTATANITAVVPAEAGNVAANTVTQLKVPIAGVDTVTNPAATTGGSDIETDTALRERALVALIALGRGTVGAIAAAVESVPGVLSVFVDENLTTHDITVTVEGPTIPDADVTDAVEDTRPAGIPATIQNPTLIDIYVETDVEVEDEPSDAASQIETAIIDYVNDLGVGVGVIFSKLFDIIFNVGTWVNDVTDLKLDIVSPPTGTSNISIGATEKAETDVTQVDVTTT